MASNEFQIKFHPKRADKSKWVSTDGRWCIQRVSKTDRFYKQMPYMDPTMRLGNPEYVWILIDLKNDARYEKETIIEAARTANHKVRVEESLREAPIT